MTQNFEYVSATRADTGVIPAGTKPRVTENNDGTLTQHVNIDSASTDSGLATADNQTNGAQLTRLVDADGHQVNVQSITAQLDGTEYGAVTNALIHGRDSQGNWHDVKTTPSGALTVESTIAGIDTGVTLPTTRADDFYNDAFQWLRVSQKNKRFDFDFDRGENPFVWDYVGNGTVTYSDNSRDLTIGFTGTATSDSQAVIQHYYNIYTPLSSQATALTGTLNNGALAGTARAFLRSTVTGTTTEEYIAISAGMADFSKSAIFVMDFQSLRVGRIRFGLDQQGVYTPIGQITNDNERATGYWQTPNLPVMYRVYNTATNTITEIAYGDELNGIGFQFVSALNAAQTVRAICAGVASEGGGDLLSLEGQPFVAPPTTAPIVAAKTVSTTLIPLVSIRVASLLYGLTNRELVIPTSFSLQTDNAIEYVVLYRPTLTGASWVALSTDSGVEYDISATAVTGGYQIEGDFLTAGQNQPTRLNNLLGRTIMSLGSAGVPDIVTIAAIRTGSTNASVRAKIKGKELR